MDDSLITLAAEKIGNRYLLINIVAKRVKQLKDGAPPLVETDSESHLEIALREVIAGKSFPRFPEQTKETEEASATQEEEEQGAPA